MYNSGTDRSNPSLYTSSRFPSSYDESQTFRRRTSSRVNLPAHSEDRISTDYELLSDAPRVRNQQIPRGTFAYNQSDDLPTNHDGLDTISLTPVLRSSADRFSSSRFGFTLPTPGSLPVTQGHLDLRESQWRPESARTGSYDSMYSASSSVTGISASGAHIAKPGHQLGVVDKFTNKWPKPLPLKSSGRSLDDPGLTDAELKKSVDAVLLESGVGGGSGILGFEWFSRWTGFKWCLLFSVFSVLTYGIAGLSCAIGIWFRIWHDADIMSVADNDILILITLASSTLIFSALVGLTGTLLSSRPILAIYTLLLWPCFISMCAIGYTAYKRAAFALEQKLDMSWSQYYTSYGRLLIQNSLECCGWSNPNHGGTPSKSCYPRTPLVGCKGPLMRFEQANLQLVWSAVFSLVPMHIVNIVVAMLCANHVTRTFGSGITPKRYRLTAEDVQEDAGRVIALVFKRERVSGQAQGGVQRPEIVKVPVRRVFRADREETMALLDRLSE